MQSEPIITDLSKREHQVMEYVVMGLSNKLIARKLFLTERTIKFHCSNIYRKLRIKNRASLVVFVQQCGYADVGRQAA
ncbi:response regulator transcription factor [Planctobacterium marinum]|uniref:response regulator transcription factor n=1 Tax=Planctobacterium marinum TaxID=1631968 RepID=UPI001E2AC34A|nr:LuxR C-terminal-related transcriptional regulator [Planctobacterium marinum]MCC2605061.1 LuxR C-terminal-related transcriptional regulator [Planctobacterium marinum]